MPPWGTPSRAGRRAGELAVTDGKGPVVFAHSGLFPGLRSGVAKHLAAPVAHGVAHLPGEGGFAFGDVGGLTGIGDHVEEAPLGIEPVGLAAGGNGAVESGKEEALRPVGGFLKEEGREIAPVERFGGGKWHAGERHEGGQEVDGARDLRNAAVGRDFAGPTEEKGTRTLPSSVPPFFPFIPPFHRPETGPLSEK